MRREIVGDVVVVTRIALGIAQLDVALRAELQPQALDTAAHHVRPSDQDRLGEALVQQHLDRAQHALLLAVGEGHAHRPLARPLEDRLHGQPGAEHELRQPLAVGIEILDRPGGDAARHGRPGDRNRQLDRKARVERLRDDALGSVEDAGPAVRRRHRVGRRGPGHCGDRVRARDLHRIVDRGRADVQGAAENEWEAQDVVDLVGIVAAARGDDRIGSRRARVFGLDFRHRVRERQNQRPLRHGLHHGLGHQARRRQSEKDVGTLDRLGERALGSVLSVARLVGIHELGPTGVDHPLDVDHQEILLAQTERGQQIEAGERRRAGAARREPHLLDALAQQVQPVEHGRGDDDRGAVLVVVEHRDAHALAQPGLDLEALRRLDVLEIDRAEGRLERGHDVDQLVGVALVDFDVEGVDAGELLEQDRLALHHRLGGERPDGAEAEHGGAVADHCHEIAARGQRRGLVRVERDALARGRHARRIGQRQVALVGQRLGRDHRELAGRLCPMVVERGLAQLIRPSRLLESNACATTGEGPGDLPRAFAQNVPSRPRIGQQRYRRRRVFALSVEYALTGERCRLVPGRSARCGGGTLDSNSNESRAMIGEGLFDAGAYVVRFVRRPAFTHFDASGRRRPS